MRPRCEDESPCPSATPGSCPHHINPAQARGTWATEDQPVPATALRCSRSRGCIQHRGRLRLHERRAQADARVAPIAIATGLGVEVTGSRTRRTVQKEERKRKGGSVCHTSGAPFLSRRLAQK